MSEDGSGVSVVLRELSSLRPHEETIPEHVASVGDELVADGVQRDPILVDGKDSVVLDGMHRLAALMKMGTRSAVCCEVDYQSPTIVLKRWARVYSLPRNKALLKSPEESKLEGVQDVRQAVKMAESGERAFVVVTSTSAFIPGAADGISEASDQMRNLDRSCKELGGEIRFVPEDEVDLSNVGENQTVLLIKTLKKEDVVRAGVGGRLLPCKTSMHSLDPRPVGIDFPVKNLAGATPQSLAQWVAGVKRRVLPPGSIYGGRKYKERLLFLDGR